MTPNSKTLAAAAVAGVLSAGMTACSTSDDASNPGATRSPSPSSTDQARRSYADGRYRATGWYGGLPSSIDVTVRLRDDVITDVDVTPHATDPTSLDYQERFADAVPQVVVGKPIDEVRVGRLAGSSGTPDGFNEALRRIKAEASR
jgi:uncharacterized protein with FMN-binding domain